MRTRYLNERQEYDKANASALILSPHMIIRHRPFLVGEILSVAWSPAGSGGEGGGQNLRQYRQVLYLIRYATIPHPWQDPVKKREA